MNNISMQNIHGKKCKTGTKKHIAVLAILLIILTINIWLI